MESLQKYRAIILLVGSMLRRKAEEIALKRDVEFKPSNGWSDRSRNVLVLFTRK
jgi:hypothetical protein